MNFENLKRNQKSVVQLLENSFKENRLVHVYLFSGVKEALKLDAAFYLASLIMCEDGGACGKCDSCKKIAQLANPNLYLVSPDGDSIKKEQIEALEHDFGFATEKPRVFIIQNIEKANATSANTLLKFLEELKDNCYGILLTDKIDQVLPTIISRSQLIKFLPVQVSQIKQDLTNRGINAEKAGVIANLTGDINKAFAFTKDEQIDFLITSAKKIGFEFEYSNAYLEYLKIKKEIDKLDKTYVRYFIEILMMIQKDKIDTLISRKGNRIFEEEMDVITLMRSKEDEVKILEILLDSRDRLETNANVDMIFTNLFIKIEQLEG